MVKATCLICGRPMQGQSPKEWPRFPFCSDRCRLIDLGRWLGENYRFTSPAEERLPPEGDLPGGSKADRLFGCLLSRRVAPASLASLFIHHSSLVVCDRLPLTNDVGRMTNDNKMPFLIDGYNLLYAMGLIRNRAGPTGLQKARRGLLGLLRGAYGDESSEVTVIFDAAKAPVGAVEEEDYQGIHVRYAIHQDQADDLIESLIHHHSAPRQLTVVSDDHRIQQVARRRQCTVLGCGDYLDWLDRHRKERRLNSPDTETKPEHVSEQETERWLREFRDLADDPALKEVFDPFDFENG